MSSKIRYKIFSILLRPLIMVAVIEIAAPYPADTLPPFPKRLMVHGAGQIGTILEQVQIDGKPPFMFAGFGAVGAAIIPISVSKRYLIAKFCGLEDQQRGMYRKVVLLVYHAHILALRWRRRLVVIWNPDQRPSFRA